MFNKLRANPGMALGAALFIVALIAVIVWIVRRGKKDKEGPSKPEITITGMRKTLKPDGQNKVEEYMMYEYNTATDPGTSTGSGTSATVKGSQVATNIDLVLNWTNGTGFVTNKVSKLIFKRFVRPVDAAIDDKSGDILVEDSTKHADSSSVGDFQKGEVTISGENLASSYTGGYKITTDQGHKNIIKIYYVDGDGDENLLTETNPIDISNNDLKRTLDIDKVESVTITVSPGDVAALKLAAGNSNMFYKIYSVSGAQTPALKLSSVNTTSGNVKFTHNNLTYEFGIDFGKGEDPFFKFEKISTDSDDLFLKVVDGTNANKYVVGTGTGFKLMTFDDIKSTGANFTNSRVRIVGNENAGSISRPTDMANPATTPASPSDVSGLIGHFIPSGLNVSGGVWNNQVSGKPDATVSGNVGVDGDAVWGEGGNGDDGVGGKVIFPQGATFGSTTGDYTMFYVGKYDEKDHGIGDRVGWAGRIFNSDNDQWLSGWHGGKVGVAWHYGWYTVGDEGQAYQGGKNDYILGTDAVNTFRLNGIDITTKENTTLMPANSKITINGGSLEFSSWKMKEILFYSRKLTTTEMKKVEDYLLVKHGIKRGKGVLSDTTVNAGWTNDFTNQLYGSYWTKSGGITYTADYGTPTTTMEDCRTEAATRNGVVAYGVRHGASGQKCWFLSGVGNPLGWADDTVASSNNGIHSIHCVDPDASVLNSCQ